MSKVHLSLYNSRLIISTMTMSVIYFLNGGFIFKILTGLGFVVLGIINTIYTKRSDGVDDKFAYLMMSGLALAFSGDIIISVNFVIGAILFALGHIFYFSAYCRVCKFAFRDIAFIALIFVTAALLVVFYPKFEFGSDLMKYVCLFYALVISCMVGKAASNLSEGRGRLRLALFIGSLLFCISDIALLFYMFAGANEAANTVCLFTYFPAQLTLALSIFFKLDEN